MWSMHSKSIVGISAHTVAITVMRWNSCQHPQTCSMWKRSRRSKANSFQWSTMRALYKWEFWWRLRCWLLTFLFQSMFCYFWSQFFLPDLLKFFGKSIQRIAQTSLLLFSHLSIFKWWQDEGISKNLGHESLHVWPTPWHGPRGTKRESRTRNHHSNSFKQ